MPKPTDSSKKTAATPAPAAPGTATPKPSPLLRFFIPVSFLVILLIVVVIQYTYRSTVVRNVTNLGETTNISLSKMALVSIQPQLEEYLHQMADVSPEAALRQNLPLGLKEAIQNLMSATGIVGVKICNRHGLVLYSTQPGEVGQVQLDDAEVLGAMAGRIMTELDYRDRFSLADQDAEETNLAQTYLPAMQEPFGAILGAIEFSSDVSSLVRQNEQSQFVMLVILGGAFLVIFALLVATVWRAESVMTHQYLTLYERTQPLEFLTAQMLSDQEVEKKSIAQSLHESVTQTLHAIKMQLETIVRQEDQANPLVARLAGLIVFLRSAISEIRLIATNLRPGSLDELGLLKTLDWFVKHIQMAHPRLSFDLQIRVEEERISPSLKIIIFRIVQETLNNLASLTEANEVRLVLRGGGDSIELEIAEDSLSYVGKFAPKGEQLNKALLLMRERTLLSGGDFSSMRERLWCIHTSRWHV